jgi:diguanylate cyclase (GGDEF)-like protein
LSATVGGAANLTSGAIYSAQYVWFFNWLSQLSAFSLVGVLMSELHRRLQTERSLSRQDTVTVLANTRGFYEQASLLLTVAKRTSVPVTLAYLDLDNFKAVNDRHGHEAGDRALSEAATVLRRHARASDVVARLGGDEFAILLLDAGPEAARTMLERIRSLLSEAMKNRAWPITVSIGA